MTTLTLPEPNIGQPPAPPPRPWEPLLEMLRDLGVQFAKAQKRTEDRILAVNAAIYPVQIPAQTASVTSGGALNIASGELLGPRGGNLWDVHRVSVFGLHANTEVVGLFKTPTGSTAATVAQNFVCPLVPAANQIAGSFGAFQTFGKGQCVLRAGESLQIFVASGLTANEVVTFSGDATNIAMPFVGDYFL